MTIVAMVVLAYFCGISLSVHRKIFGYKKNHRFLLFFADILFCISQAILIFVVLYYINGGYLRFYIFVIFAFTLLVYYRFHDKRVNQWVAHLFFRLGQIYRFFCRVFNILFIKPIFGLLLILLFSVKILKNLLFMIGKILYILILRPIFWLISLLIPRMAKEIGLNGWKWIYNRIAGRFSKEK